MSCWRALALTRELTAVELKGGLGLDHCLVPAPGEGHIDAQGRELIELREGIFPLAHADGQRGAQPLAVLDLVN